MKDSNEENSVEIVNSDDEIVVTVGRVEAEVTAPSENPIIKTKVPNLDGQSQCIFSFALPDKNQ